ISAVLVNVYGFLLIVTSILGLSGENILLTIVVLIGMIAYLTVAMSIVLSLINLLFFVFVKVLFPYESEEAMENKTFTLLEISPFMNLQTQIAYSILSLLHTVIYLTII